MRDGIKKKLAELRDAELDTSHPDYDVQRGPSKEMIAKAKPEIKRMIARAEADIADVERRRSQHLKEVKSGKSSWSEADVKKTYDKQAKKAKEDLKKWQQRLSEGWGSDGSQWIGPDQTITYKKKVPLNVSKEEADQLRQKLGKEDEERIAARVAARTPKTDPAKAKSIEREMAPVIAEVKKMGAQLDKLDGQLAALKKQRIELYAKYSGSWRKVVKTYEDNGQKPPTDKMRNGTE